MKQCFEQLEQCFEQLDIEMPEWAKGNWSKSEGEKRPGAGGHHGGEKPDHSSFWEKIGKDKLMELKKCIMVKHGIINNDGLLNRAPILSAINETFTGDDSNLLSSMVLAVGTCPEPKDLKILEYFFCLANTCVKNIRI